MRDGYVPPWIGPLIALSLAACDKAPDTVQGYVEGEYVRVALPLSGQVVMLAVEKGARVQADERLFALDSQAEEAALAEARARLEQARFQRDNLLTGKRVLEIRAIEAQKAQAEADLKLAALQLHRQEDLIKTGNTSPANLDNARAQFDRSQGRAAELGADLAFAHEGARAAEIASAVAAVTAAQASVAQAEWRLAQRTAMAPTAAQVEDVLFRPGEVVAAGQPVVSLLPPGNVLVKFYLGPDAIGRIAAGTALKADCQGCPIDLHVTVRYIARQASYAPPILYSRENRDKLVFLVEARPDPPVTQLHPGQPVTLHLPDAAPK